MYSLVSPSSEYFSHHANKRIATTSDRPSSPQPPFTHLDTSFSEAARHLVLEFTRNDLNLERCVSDKERRLIFDNLSGCEDVHAQVQLRPFLKKFLDHTIVDRDQLRYNGALLLNWYDLRKALEADIVNDDKQSQSSSALPDSPSPAQPSSPSSQSARNALGEMNSSFTTILRAPSDTASNTWPESDSKLADITFSSFSAHESRPSTESSLVLGTADEHPSSTLSSPRQNSVPPSPTPRTIKSPNALERERRGSPTPLTEAHSVTAAAELLADVDEEHSDAAFRGQDLHPPSPRTRTSPEKEKVVSEDPPTESVEQPASTLATPSILEYDAFFSVGNRSPNALDNPMHLQPVPTSVSFSVGNHTVDLGSPTPPAGALERQRDERRREALVAGSSCEERQQTGIVQGAAGRKRAREEVPEESEDQEGRRSKYARLKEGLHRMWEKIMPPYFSSAMQAPKREFRKKRLKKPSRSVA
ncbi:hypothetical protein BDZ89DRAFT_1038548 [Hymenopellis radicata]|nr:hypothetical protein BDZ89DRAFT_1038548 [Hymenopellis radicata]